MKEFIKNFEDYININEAKLIYATDHQITGFEAEHSNIYKFLYDKVKTKPLYYVEVTDGDSRYKINVEFQTHEADSNQTIQKHVLISVMNKFQIGEYRIYDDDIICTPYDNQISTDEMEDLFSSVLVKLMFG